MNQNQLEYTFAYKENKLYKDNKYFNKNNELLFLLDLEKTRHEPEDINMIEIAPTLAKSLILSYNLYPRILCVLPEIKHKSTLRQNSVKNLIQGIPNKNVGTSSLRSNYCSWVTTLSTLSLDST